MSSVHQIYAYSSSLTISLVIAFIFTFYILSFVMDLAPAIRTRWHVPQGERMPEMASFGYPATQQISPGVSYEQPLTTDSMGDMANRYRGPVANGGFRSDWAGTSQYSQNGQVNELDNQGRYKEQRPIDF